MKKIILIPILLVSFLSETCEKHKTAERHSTQISIVGDITDSHFLLPEAEPILRLYQFDADKNTEGFFRICTVTDMHLNPAIEYHLPAGSMTEKDNTLDDPHYREKVVLTFYQAIRQAISHFNAKCHLDSSLDHSEVFSSVAGELQLMKTKTAGNNVLLVYSDLQENSDLFTCYTKPNQELMVKKPDKIIELFNASNLLPDSLKGFNIMFIYQPSTRQQDQQFEAMIRVYRKMLESRGATVKVQANSNYLN